MHLERLAHGASYATLLLFFLALLMSNASQASTLAPGGNHRNETLTAIVLTDAALESLRSTILDDAIALRTNFSDAQLQLRGTSQMLPAPEPRPIVFIAIGLMAFATLPRSLRGDAGARSFRRAPASR